MSQDTRAKTAIKEFFKIPDNIRKLKTQASYDLWYGPITYCEECGEYLSECECKDKYPGWNKAIDILKEWADENLHEVYYEPDTEEVSHDEPEGFCDLDGEHSGPCDAQCWVAADEYWMYDLEDVKSAIFGKELAENLR